MVLKFAFIIHIPLRKFVHFLRQTQLMPVSVLPKNTKAIAILLGGNGVDLKVSPESTSLICNVLLSDLQCECCDCILMKELLTRAGYRLFFFPIPVH